MSVAHRSSVDVQRICGNGGWSPVDYSGCTLVNAATDPFLILWFVTDAGEIIDPTVNLVDEVNAVRESMQSQVCCLSVM